MTQVIANREMAEAWEREAEDWLANAERYERVDRHLWRRFRAEVPVVVDGQVLDVGCGAGSSTIDLARQATEGHATGLDISRRMVEHATAAAASAGVDNVDFVQGDAQVHPLAEGAFDLVVSAYGTMFFADPVAAFANLGGALRPGGELAMLTWRDLEHNEWLTAVRGALAVGRSLPRPPAGAPGPFGLAEEDHVRAVLTAAGFEDVRLDVIEEPMDLGADADDAFAFLGSLGMTRGLTEGLDAADRERAMAALRDLADAHATPDGVLLGASAWLVRARR